MTETHLTKDQERKILKFEVKYIAYALIAFLCMAIAFILFVLAILPYSAVSKENIFEIEKGMTTREIGELLRQKGMIRSPFLFVSLAKLSGREKRVKAGFYYFERPLSLVDILYRITDGKNGTRPFEVTVQEGATIYNIGKLFEDKKMFNKEAFWEKAGLTEDHFSGIPFEPSNFLRTSSFDVLFEGKPHDAGYEGFLFPDTYYFPPGIAPEDVIEVMLRNFDLKLTQELRDEIARQGKTVYEVITMASIIEREAFNEKDAPIISGILWKRIRENFPLQVDAVLVYITGRGSRTLTIDDLATDSPYNVYKKIGLPPTPISNPGMTAIKAAIYPEESSYWYYLHDRRGRAHYAKTFEEHKENKVKYLFR